MIVSVLSNTAWISHEGDQPVKYDIANSIAEIPIPE